MESKIKKNVMRRVHTIRTVRPITSGVVLASVFFIVSLYAIGKVVFVAQVYRNMPAVQDIGAVLMFMVNAFLHTEFLVQALSLTVLLTAAWMLRDIGRVIAGEGRLA